jgi:hypothetical protein
MYSTRLLNLSTLLLFCPLVLKILPLSHNHHVYTYLIYNNTFITIINNLIINFVVVPLLGIANANKTRQNMWTLRDIC